MAAKAPWFPFYTGDFLASPDVQLMAAHEVGAYVLMLTHSWQSDRPGYLPNDDGRLRRIGRLTPEQWADSKDLLLSKWPAADATERYNPRLKSEADKWEKLVERKAEAGRKSAELRAARAAQEATGVQQVFNRCSTGVENTATGVGENANQSQPQSHVAKATNNIGATAPVMEPLPAAPESPKAKPPKDDTPDPYPFVTFWEEYGKKEGSKPAAERKWKALPLETRRLIMAGLPAYKVKRPDKQFRCAPDVFLNQRRWEAEEWNVITAPAPMVAPRQNHTENEHWQRPEGTAMRELGFDDDDLTDEARARRAAQYPNYTAPATDRQFQTFPR